MKYVDEFRDPAHARSLVAGIADLAQRIGRPVNVMEICGGHTHTIFRFGLEQLIPESVTLVHGPGCPVCVLPMGRVDDCLALARMPGVIMTTFGDAMRLPGATGSLLEARAGGADVRMVYSPMDALQIARENPDNEVIFFGVGFETTMPSTALTVLEAHETGVKNFSLFSNHITIVPTIKAVLDSPDLQLDGFIGPGHVSMVIGMAPYQFIAEKYNCPLVISGFEPLDILQSLYMVLAQLEAGVAKIENQYLRVVPEGGNRMALEAISRVFQVRPFFEWRGLGSIDHSGVRIRDELVQYDAERKFDVPAVRIADPKACQCGEVLKGAIKPWECKVFGTACTPKTPLGALMVSSEGACAAYYQYGDVEELRARSRS